MEEIFNIIIQDKKFLENVKSSVNNIMLDGKVDISDVPEIILLITTTINTFNNLNINESMLPELIKKIFDFIVPNKNPEFDKIINSAIKLVMFQPIIQKEVKKCCNFFSCFRKKEISNESKPLIEELNSMSSISENKVEVSENKIEVSENKIEVIENKVDENKVIENKVDENKVDENKVDENKVDENKVNENKVNENKVVENKNKVVENKKNKLKLHNIEITSDDELVNINVINEVNENINE
jgi:hypothetical protein